MLDEIRERRSIRAFTDEPVDDQLITRIIEMGTWAPSGLNNQPWRFMVVSDPQTKQELSRQTKYGSIIENAPCCIAVFLDQSGSYDRVKDIQAIGACIQNMLLTIHHLGLGAVWLGEILNKRERVEEILEVGANFELMAVVAVGYPSKPGGQGRRKPVEEVILGWR